MRFNYLHALEFLTTLSLILAFIAGVIWGMVADDKRNTTWLRRLTFAFLILGTVSGILASGMY